MNNEKFNETCEKAVEKYIKEHFGDMSGLTFPTDFYTGEIFTVWECKTLQNRKAILGLGGSNQLLFEVTYNGDKDETYVDVYDKKTNFSLKGDK